MRKNTNFRFGFSIAKYSPPLIGVAGKFPSNYMGGMMAGQALGGIFPALVNIAVIALRVNPPELGFYCFLIAFLFVLLSLVMFMVIQTTAFFRHYAGTGDIAYRSGRKSIAIHTTNLHL